MEKLTYLKNVMYQLNELIETVEGFAHDENAMKDKTICDIDDIKKLLVEIESDIEEEVKK